MTYTINNYFNDDTIDVIYGEDIGYDELITQITKYSQIEKDNDTVILHIWYEPKDLIEIPHYLTNKAVQKLKEPFFNGSEIVYSTKEKRHTYTLDVNVELHNQDNIETAQYTLLIESTNETQISHTFILKDLFPNDELKNDELKIVDVEVGDIIKIHTYNPQKQVNVNRDSNYDQLYDYFVNWNLEQKKSFVTEYPLDISHKSVEYQQLYNYFKDWKPRL